MRKPLATRPVNGASNGHDRALTPAERKNRALEQYRRPRKRGTPNKVTRLLKEAILMAAEMEGFDCRGKQGLVGYLRRIARDEPVAFCGLLGRVIPLQVVGDPLRPVTIITDSMELKEAAQAYADTVASPLQIEHQPGEVVSEAEVVEPESST